jgi:hypothetical protein
MAAETRHYEESKVVNGSAQELFAFVDNPMNLTSHMEKPSWKMGWGWMKTKTDEKRGLEEGSVISVRGKVLGFPLFLKERVIKREPPNRKSWKTFGDISLLVIGHYELGFEIEPEDSNSRLRVYIDYELPESAGGRILGYFFGGMYAKWCVRQMLKDSQMHFKKGG